MNTKKLSCRERVVEILKKIFKSYYQSYGFNSVILRNTLKLFIIFLVITMIPTTIAYTLSARSIKKDIENFNKEETQKLGIVVENVFRDAEYLASEILSDSTVRLYMSMGADIEMTEALTKTLAERLTTYMVSRTELDSIYLYNPKQNHICSTDGITSIEKFPDKGWLDEYDVGITENYKLYPRRMDNKFVNAFTLIKKLENSGCGVIVNIDTYKIRKKLSILLSNETESYIVSGNDILYGDVGPLQNIIITGDWELKKENFKNRGFICQSIPSKFYDMEFVASIPENLYSHRMKSIYFVYMAAIISIIAIVLLISFALGLNNMEYVTGFIDILDRKHRPKILKENEIKYVTDKIIGILDDNENLRRDIEQRMTEYDNMQKTALNTQITPHFINNSLGAILNCNLDESGLDSKTSEMLIKLSKIIRYSYVGEEIFTTVEEEVNYIKLYVDFLQCRYNNFECEFIYDESIRDNKMLKMIVQPFVENAVFYGTAKAGYKLTIKLQGIDDGIFISVRDNGTGIEPDKLKAILDGLDNDEISSKHIGIKNVYKRLKLIYEKNFVFEIKSEPDKYCEIIIIIKNKT